MEAWQRAPARRSCDPAWASPSTRSVQTRRTSSVENGQFLLPYEAVAEAENPGQYLAAFLHTTYRSAADLGGWDRQILEDHPHTSGGNTASWHSVTEVPPAGR